MAASTAAAAVSEAITVHQHTTNSDSDERCCNCPTHYIMFEVQLGCLQELQQLSHCTSFVCLLEYQLRHRQERVLHVLAASHTAQRA
jgi:hypothetical protein